MVHFQDNSLCYFLHDQKNVVLPDGEDSPVLLRPDLASLKPKS